MSTRRFLEVEAKFAVSEAAPVPDLTRIPGVAGIAETRRHSLSAIYYDTRDLRLTRAKITLRRRSGGHDDGWHIKLPGSQGRIEIQAELGEPTEGQFQAPAELLEQVRAIIRREELVPIAQVDNDRSELVLADEGGVRVAEFCDDHVTAWSLLPGGQESRWREWEFELGAGTVDGEQGPELIRLATGLLISAGARVSRSPSKLLTALGESINQVPAPVSVADLDEDSPAAAVVTALQANRDKLIDYDPRVRRDEWDSVHQMRVATRELRSHMQTFEGILGGAEFEHLEEELKLLAGLLGSARDAEVVEERFHALIDSEDSGVLDEATRTHLREDMGAEYRRAHRRVVATLDSERYLALLDSLDRLLADPPVLATSPETPPVAEESAAAEDRDAATALAELDSVASVKVVAESAEQDESTAEEVLTEEEAAPEAGDPAAAREEMEEILSEHLDAAYRKLQKRHRKAVKNWDNPELSLHEREEYFHDMRKAAKKLRYSAEAVGSATDLKTKPIYKACKEMQSVLGDFQDSVTSRDFLLKKAQQARARGEDTFGYGLLYQRERQIGLQSLEDYSAAAKKITAAYGRLEESRKNRKGKKNRKKDKKK